MHEDKFAAFMRVKNTAHLTKYVIINIKRFCLDFSLCAFGETQPQNLMHVDKLTTFKRKCEILCP